MLVLEFEEWCLYGRHLESGKSITGVFRINAPERRFFGFLFQLTPRLDWCIADKKYRDETAVPAFSIAMKRVYRNTFCRRDV